MLLLCVLLCTLSFFKLFCVLCLMWLVICCVSVGRLCPCDTHRDVCDINCCCDPECISQEVSLFTSCSVLTVSKVTLYGKDEGLTECVSDVCVKVVPVTVDSVTLQSVSGTQTELRAGSGGTLTPAVMRPGLCANVVLKVSPNPFRYDGVTTRSSFCSPPTNHMSASLTCASTGLSRSVGHFLSVFHSEAHQDCLQGPHQRSLVLFGLNSQSGCTLRLTDTFNCSLLSELLLSVLRGSDPAQYVALFGNSLENVELYYYTKSENKKSSRQSILCTAIEWTKYGALSNPQAQIVSIKEIIQTNSSSLVSSGVLPISSSVAFIPVSAPARPGYRATPTINARLPFDFFFPFV
uniref:Tectonic domain-containing protein n=1 Tax=Gouania willdenowi TaxID=441366 RepID=A0A8C5GRL1_GOUWI